MSNDRKNNPHYPNPYATGGHNQPVANATAGRRYRVRNDDKPIHPHTKVWATGLSFEQAHKLKERLAGQRKTTNPLVEDEAVPFPPAVVVLAPPPPPPPPPAPVVQPPADPDANGANGTPDDAILTEMGETDLDELGDLA